jgi:MSHA pilin protein MshC
MAAGAMQRPQAGFSLLELLAVLVLLAILSAVVSIGTLPASSFQLQASRDRLVAAFFSAQQRAMVQTRPVRLTLAAPNQIDIREDSDLDGSFADEASLSLGGTQFPQTLLPNQSLTPAVFDFDRLGKTSVATLVLSDGASSVTLAVSATGFID